MKKKMIFMNLFFIAGFLFSQELKDFPKIEKSISSVEKSFSILLENFSAMNRSSYSMEKLNRPYSTQEDVIQYINFILLNMKYDKIKNYVFRLDKNIKELELNHLSKKQQKSFKLFLDTAFVDEYHFLVYKRFINNFDIPKNAKLDYDRTLLVKIEKELKELYNKKEKLENELNSSKKTNDEDVWTHERIAQERAKLKNKKYSSAEEVIKDQQRIEELREIERKLRYKLSQPYEPTPIEKELDKTNKQVSDLEWKLKKEKKNIGITAEKKYRENMFKNINNFYIWLDYFKSKNNVLTEYLILTETKEHLSTMIENEVPQRELSKYKKLLDELLKGWKLTER